MYMCEFLTVRQFAQSSATRHLQTQRYIVTQDISKTCHRIRIELTRQLSFFQRICFNGCHWIPARKFFRTDRGTNFVGFYDKSIF